MKNIAKIFWVLFFTCSAIVLISLLAGFWEVSGLIQPFLIPIMAVALFLELTSQKSAQSIVISFGCKDKLHLLCTFILYTLGCLFLNFMGKDGFVKSMVFFLFGHLAYLLFFLRMLPELKTKMVLWYVLALLVPAVVIPMSFDQPLKLSVVIGVYIFVLLLLALEGYATLLLSDSIERIDDDDDPDSWNENDALHRAGSFILFGALLFMASDFIIVIRYLFGIGFKFDMAVVLLLYLSAHVQMAKAVLGLQSRFCMFTNVRKK